MDLLADVLLSVSGSFGLAALAAICGLSAGWIVVAALLAFAPMALKTDEK